MIGIRLLVVGKLKDAWLRDGCAEYLKRIGLWSAVKVEELDEARLPAAPGEAQIAAAIQQEGERILVKIPRGARVVALCIEGKTLSSEALCGYLEKAAISGADTAVFIIGGSHGLSDTVKARADLRLSMSPMTFPHQLARLMLCEQIYRALSISAGAKYHK